MVDFQDADDFFTTVAEGGGKAFRFTDIDGIGPATADKITSIRGVQNPEDVADMSADELSDKAGISRSRATKAINGGGGNPNISKQSNSGTVSAAGIRQRKGDFWVEYTDMDKARAKNDSRSRSEEAIRQDDRRRAPVTTDLEQWQNAPGMWDFPGVDTPTQEPGVRPKDYKAGGEFQTADFDESGQAEYDEPDGSEYPKKTDAASGKENSNLETSENRTIPASVINEEVPEPIGVAPGVSKSDFAEGKSRESMVSANIGGPRYNFKKGRVVETDRVDEEQKPPETALRRQQLGTSKYLDQKDNSPQTIASFYEDGDFDISLGEFRRRVKREKRKSPLPLDMFGASQEIAKEQGAFPAHDGSYTPYSKLD